MRTSPTASAGRTLVQRLRREGDDAASIPVRLAAMLFLRWADFREAEAEAMAAFEDRDYAHVLPATLHWRTWHYLPPAELPAFFSEKLPAAIERLENAHEFLAAALRRILPAFRDMGGLTPCALGALTEWLAPHPFETPRDRQLLLDQFDILVDQCGGWELRRFCTPLPISDLVAALAAPEPGERLYDPSFGTANLLTAAWQRLHSPRETRLARPAGLALEIYGLTNDVPAYLIGLVRLVLAGVSEPQLELGNSLEHESPASPEKDGFDVIVSNPPWSGDVKLRGLGHYPVPTNNVTGLFLQQALSQLRPEGRAVMVVPWTFLFQSGKIQSVRQWLLARHRVDAVVHLGERAFQSRMTVRAAILLVRKNRGPTERVRMVDGEAFFEARPEDRSAPLLPRQIAELVAAVQQRSPGDRAWDLPLSALERSGYDLSPSRLLDTGLERILASLGDRVTIAPLKELGRIRSGTTVPRSQLVECRDGEHAMAYVRIGDLQHGAASEVQVWVSSQAAAEMPRRHPLRAGEILLSRSGTIGKAGMVRNGAVGGIASNAFFILTPGGERIDPHYLNVYLASAECRAWLEARATGAVIRSLRKCHVEELPVPVPPLAMQQRIAAEAREARSDALELLLGILAEGADPLATWVTTALEHLTGVRTPKLADVLDLKVLGSRFQKAARGLAESEYRNWAGALERARDALQPGVVGLEGLRLFTNLQIALRHLAEASNRLPPAPGPGSALQERARKLTAILTFALETESDELASKGQLWFDAFIHGRLSAEHAESVIRVENSGVLPMQAIQIRSTPDWGTREVPELGAGAREQFSLIGNCPEEICHVPIRLDWTARGLNGRTLQGSQELDIYPPSLREQAEFEQAMFERTEQVVFGHSPYFVSKPVGPDRDDVFFGRAALLNRIKEQIQSRNTVLLEGNRRAGKTSILKHLEGLRPIPGWLGVYCSFQGGEGHKHATGMPTSAVWRTLAQSLAEGLRELGGEIPLPDGTALKSNASVGVARACRHGISEEAPWEDFQEYLSAVMRVLNSRSLGLVLMVDEFDKLQEGIDNGVTSPQIPENIRFLIQNVPDFVAVLTGSRRMQRLRHEYWSALYGLGNRVGVTALDEAAARLLVTEPVKDRLTYSEEALSYVVGVTARQPFLIQSLCNRVFANASQTKQASITLPAVRSAAAGFVEDNEHFASLWGYAETERRRFILALCHREASGPDPLTFGVLQDRMATTGLRVRDAELAGDLDFLKELELVEFQGKGSGSVYRLTIPLMGQWLDVQHDFDAILARARAEQESQL